MAKLEWDINAANYTLSESDAYLDAVNIYRALLCKGYIELNLNTVEEFLIANGRHPYPSLYNANKMSAIDYLTIYKNQQIQRPQTSIPCQVQIGLLANVYFGHSAQNSYYNSSDHNIQNNQQNQNLTAQALIQAGPQTYTPNNAQSDQTDSYPDFYSQSSYYSPSNRHLQNSHQVQNINTKVPIQADPQTFIFYNVQAGLADVYPGPFFQSSYHAPCNLSTQNSHQGQNINTKTSIQAGPQTFSPYNVQSDPTNTYPSLDAWSSSYLPFNHYIQNSQQALDTNIQTTIQTSYIPTTEKFSDSRPLTDISNYKNINETSYNKMFTQDQQITQPNLYPKKENTYCKCQGAKKEMTHDCHSKKALSLPTMQSNSLATIFVTNNDKTFNNSTQTDQVPYNFNLYTNLFTYPIISTNITNYQSTYTTNINQNFYQTKDNTSNLQKNGTNSNSNSNLLSANKKWDLQADAFVIKAFHANISLFETWVQLIEDGYSIEMDDVVASRNCQGLIPFGI